MLKEKIQPKTYPRMTGKRATGWILTWVILAILPFCLEQMGLGWVRIADMALLYVLLAIGLNLVVGYVGLLDLGYVAFFAVGAYLYALLNSAHLSTHFAWIAQWFPDGLHTSAWIVIPLAALLAAITGILLGAPTLRLRGDYLAIVTLGFGEVIRIFINNLDYPINITNGPRGIGQVAPLNWLGIDFSQSHEFLGINFNSLTLYFYVIGFFVLLAWVVCERLQYSRLGRSWMAIREDELAAKAMGINTLNLKLLAFALGATFGGVSGTLFASFQSFVSPESFSITESILIVAMVVLGGSGNLPGVVLGAVLLSVLPEALRYVVTPIQMATGGRIDGAILRQLIVALAMIGVMLWRPNGLWPIPEHGKKRAKKAKKVGQHA